MKILITLLFAFVAMSGVVKAAGSGTAPEHSAEAATRPLPAERTAPDGAGALEALSPDAPGGGGSTYAFQWQMLPEGAGYFGEAMPIVPVTVTELAATCIQSECAAECNAAGCAGGVCVNDSYCSCVKCDF